MKYKEWLQGHIINLESTIVRFEQRSIRLQTDYKLVVAHTSESSSRMRLIEVYDSNVKRQEAAIKQMKALHQMATHQLRKIEERNI